MCMGVLESKTVIYRSLEEHGLEYNSFKSVILLVEIASVCSIIVLIVNQN